MAAELEAVRIHLITRDVVAVDVADLRFVIERSFWVDLATILGILPHGC